MYSYGLVLVELLTGKEATSPVMAEIRRLIRDECAERCLDERLRSYGEQGEQEMVETLQLALLCAAEAHSEMEREGRAIEREKKREI